MPRHDVYESITDRVIAAIEEGGRRTARQPHLRPAHWETKLRKYPMVEGWLD